MREGFFAIFTNDGQAPGYANSSGYACILGNYSSSTGTGRLLDLNLKITAANTGASVLLLGNIDDSVIDLNINDCDLYVGNSYPNKKGVVYGTGVGQNVFIKGNISDLPASSNLVGTRQGNYFVGTLDGVLQSRTHLNELYFTGANNTLEVGSIYHTTNGLSLWSQSNVRMSSTSGLSMEVGNAGASLQGTRVLEFGKGETKETNAGKIGYKTFSSGLDIVGAGTSSGSRVVRLYDYAIGK